MANPYTQPYEKYRGIGNVAPASRQEQQQRQSASGTADILRMLAGAAPAVGSAAGLGIGALLAAPTGGMSIPAGAALGGAIGGGLGQAVGGLAGEGASATERPYMEKQAARDRQIEMLLQALGSRR